MNQRDKFTITLLSTAHLVLDSYSSFLFPLLPLMAVKLNLKPAQIGFLTPTLMIASSLMQPIYGMISDRYLKRSMAVFGPLVAAVFLSCLGLANSLPMLMAIVICGGIGIGSFHPQGAALVSRAAMFDGGKHQGLVMSVFSSTGTVGYALGPLIIALVVSRFGLEHSWYTMGWGVAMAALMWFYCPSLERIERHADAPSLSTALRAARGPLTLLYFAVVLRSAVSVSVQTFLPFALQNSGLTTTLVRLRRPVKHASHTRTDTDNLIVRVQLSDGKVGFGEGVPRDYVTGETIDSTIDLLKRSALTRQLKPATTFPEVLANAEAIQLPFLVKPLRDGRGDVSKGRGACIDGVIERLDLVRQVECKSSEGLSTRRHMSRDLH